MINLPNRCFAKPQNFSISSEEGWGGGLERYCAGI